VKQPRSLRVQWLLHYSRMHYK